MRFLLILPLLFASIVATPVNITNGLKTTKHNGARIIGGEPAKAGQYNYAASIYLRTADGRYFCGGALISQQWIITSGQCVSGALSFDINLGSNHLTEDDPNRLTLSTSFYELHPDFDAMQFVADIGLIKLHLPISYNAYIQRVLLAYDHIDDGSEVTAIGWGQTSDDIGDLSEELRYVDLAVVPLDECKAVYGQSIINDNMICVAGNNNEGTCHGDTGTPLLQYQVSSRSIRHVGVASFISSNACEGTDPSGYTRLFSYRDWISATAGI